MSVVAKFETRSQIGVDLGDERGVNHRKRRKLLKLASKPTALHSVGISSPVNLILGEWCSA